MTDQEKSILFVCTGNVFRSLSADLALRQALASDSAYSISSAGTHALPKPIRTDVSAALSAHNLDPSQHVPRLLTAPLLNEASLVIVMGTEVQRYLETNFNYKAVLFNEICYGRSETIRDLWEVVPDYKTNPTAAAVYVRCAVDYIVGAVPELVKALPRYLQPLLAPGETERAQDRPLSP